MLLWFFFGCFLFLFFFEFEFYMLNIHTVCLSLFLEWYISNVWLKFFMCTVHKLQLYSICIQFAARNKVNEFLNWNLWLLYVDMFAWICWYVLVFTLLTKELSVFICPSTDQSTWNLSKTLLRSKYPWSDMGYFFTYSRALRPFTN